MQKVFFSWQDDTNKKVGRNFLMRTIEKACQQLSRETEISGAERSFAIDSDTAGVSGQPPIVETIFRKIDESSVYVADLTFVASRIDGRPSPNPNVLIEYGWALKSRTHRLIIAIMNTAYGKPDENNMPFNMKHFRWPITYELPENCSKEELSTVRKELSKKVARAIELVLEDSIDEKTKTDEINGRDNPRFCEPEKSIGFDSDWDMDTSEIFLRTGDEMWFRVIPKECKKQELSPYKIKQMYVTGLQPLYSGRGGWNHMISESGAGIYVAIDGREKKKRDAAGCVVFFETGEIWAIDLDYLDTSNRLHQPSIERYFSDALSRYSSLLSDACGADSFSWIAGLRGIKGKGLMYPAAPGKNWISNGGFPCLTSEIIVNGVHRKGESPIESLLPLFNEIFKKCGRERPDYLSQK